MVLLEGLSDKEQCCAVQKPIGIGRSYPKTSAQGQLVIYFTFEMIHLKKRRKNENWFMSNQFVVNVALLQVDFCRIKQFSSNPSIKAEYTTKIKKTLLGILVDEPRHAAIIDKIFAAVDKAVAPNPALEVGVFHIIYRGLKEEDSRPTSSLFKGLEVVTDLNNGQEEEDLSCSICLNDFDFDFDFAAQGHQVQSPITCLPCAHHFHLDCIVRWLKEKRPCPMCRRPMPWDISWQLNKNNYLNLSDFD